jgi:hypothetical protein
MGLAIPKLLQGRALSLRDQDCFDGKPAHASPDGRLNAHGSIGRLNAPALAQGRRSYFVNRGRENSSLVVENQGGNKLLFYSKYPPLMSLFSSF